MDKKMMKTGIVMMVAASKNTKTDPIFKNPPTKGILPSKIARGDRKITIPNTISPKAMRRTVLVLTVLSSTAAAKSYSLVIYSSLTRSMESIGDRNT